MKNYTQESKGAYLLGMLAGFGVMILLPVADIAVKGEER